MLAFAEYTGDDDERNNRPVDGIRYKTALCVSIVCEKQRPSVSIGGMLKATEFRLPVLTQPLFTRK
jgi:hypothetical protein